jgi:xanthine dehydrogenase YagS FAD-binding subunit
MTTLTIATTLEDAFSANGEIRAGGTDFQERRRSGVSKGDIIDISRLSELKKMLWDDYGMIIGALVEITTFGMNPHVTRHYPGLAMAARSIATPQIRAVGTMGGTLLQRTRCRYYRHPNISCYKKGGDCCPARIGIDHSGVCFDLGSCVYPHPSSIGMALLGYEAEVEIFRRARLKLIELYGDGSDPSCDHQLRSGELLSHIHLPPPVPNEQAAYSRIMIRAGAEWPLVECLVRLVIESGTIVFARVAVGGVANIPMRLPHVEAQLSGQRTEEKTLLAVAELAAQRVDPIPTAAYKAHLVSSAVLDALQQLVIWS